MSDSEEDSGDEYSAIPRLSGPVPNETYSIARQSLRELAEARGELTAARGQLTAALAEIAELRTALAAAEEQLATAHTQLAAHSQPPPRASISIPTWLRDGEPGAGAPAEQVDVLRGRAESVSHPLRFTADEMPSWLTSASQRVAALDDVEEEESSERSASEAGSPVRDDAPSSSEQLLAISFDKIPESAVLVVRVAAHALVGTHIEHVLEVTLDAQSWTVNRRYREFVKLHASAAKCLALGGFAVPKLLLHTPAALKAREAQLEEFLEQCVAKARAAREPLPALERFLGLHVAVDAS